MVCEPPPAVRRNLLAEIQQNGLPLLGVHAQCQRLLGTQFLILAVSQVYMASATPVAGIVTQEFHMKYLSAQPDLKITFGTRLAVLEDRPFLIGSGSRGS